MIKDQGEDQPADILFLIKRQIKYFISGWEKSHDH